MRSPTTWRFLALGAGFGALVLVRPANQALLPLVLVRAGGVGLEDWDLASALEVVARARLAAGDTGEAAHYAELARRELETIADPDDREVIEGQVAELGV